MIGAIVGDIVGSRFEPQNWKGDQFKSKEFELFTDESKFTDDTVCSCALASLMLEDAVLSEENIAARMHSFCRNYLDRGFGRIFSEWLKKEEVSPPLGSWGNGAAMRVSPLAWGSVSFLDLMQDAYNSAVITHNKFDAVRGASTIAGCVWMGRMGKTKGQIESFVASYCYPIGRKIDDIRPEYEFDTSCKGSVPVAIQAFLESTSFENAIRLAVSVGGDSDTIASMAGAIAHAYYSAWGKGVHKQLYEQAMDYLTEELKEIVLSFCDKYSVPLYYEGPVGYTRDLSSIYK